MLTRQNTLRTLALTAAFLSLTATLPAFAADAAGTGARVGILHFLRDRHATNKQDSDTNKGANGIKDNTKSDTFGDRDIIMYVPSQLPAMGQRALVLALHGGGGNASYMVEHLHMNDVAEKHGFIVAYLNGTSAATMLPGKMKAWNGGMGCCGEPFTKNVDDVGYITDAVSYLVQKYGIDPTRVYSIGHSNGAIMTQTLFCTTNLLRTGLSLAGSLMVQSAECPAVRGKHFYAIHGALDANVPIVGGKGTKGVTNIAYRSEAETKEIYERFGATYNLLVEPESDHKLEHLDDAVRKNEGISLAEKAAQLFGLAGNTAPQ